MKSLDQIRRDLRYISSYEAVIYGSYATGEYIEGSDIDVAVITRERDRSRNFKIQLDLWGKVPSSTYDVRVFELLPIRVKASVIRKYLVLFGKEPEISEYFYKWRKIWEDVRRRIELISVDEKVRALERRKVILEKLSSMRSR